MASNSFGRLLRITTSGESHGPGMGVIIDGCPPGINIDIDFIQHQLNRRKPGQSDLTSPRSEEDRVIIQSGIYQGMTTGAPILMWIANRDMRPADYDHIQKGFRPSHADYTYQQKYGVRDHRGSGRASARETANWVAAGALAKLILQPLDLSIHAGVTAVGGIVSDAPFDQYDWTFAENHPVRCPDPKAAQAMEAVIRQVKEEGDTVGGVITCIVKGCPVGLGEPIFHKLQADLAHAMLSINACKGFEYGSGFEGASMRGSTHNDIFTTEGEKLTTLTNHSGGIQGGISNGMPIYFRVAFKPVSTLMRSQPSVDQAGEPLVLEGKGRHDPCVVPRAVPIVEALTALVLADHWLLQQATLRQL